MITVHTRTMWHMNRDKQACMHRYMYKLMKSCLEGMPQPSNVEAPCHAPSNRRRTGPSRGVQHRPALMYVCWG